eukprot:NODE_77_length_23806_cov_0.393892.p18 type:complete len:105 gc:universal NODE_77_length_23806_cov_0.393892:971-657(-)
MFKPQQIEFHRAYALVPYYSLIQPFPSDLLSVFFSDDSNFVLNSEMDIGHTVDFIKQSFAPADLIFSDSKSVLITKNTTKVINQPNQINWTEKLQKMLPINSIK